LELTVRGQDHAEVVVGTVEGKAGSSRMI
jgi:hypothetical protein